MDRLTFLGTGDSMGVPRVYCDCGVCTEAREEGRNRRLRSSVRVETEAGELLIDCGPDWKKQMETLAQRETGRVLLTHAHFDHMAGLPEWADACRWRKQTGEVFAPAEVLKAVRRMFPWLEGRLRYEEIDSGMDFAGWRIEPHKVSHGKNGFSYAYRWSTPGFKWAYCPDSINLAESAKEFFRGLDLFLLGTSFYREPFDYHTRSVYDVVEALELLEDIKPARTVFTHMSHGIDVREEYALPPGVRLAETGLQLELG